MAVVDLIAGQHLQGVAGGYTTTNTYSSGQFVFNATTGGYVDGVSLSEVALLLVDLPAEIAAAKISQLVFSGNIEATGSVGEVGVDYLANSQLYQLTQGSGGGLGGFDLNNEPAEAEFVTITQHSDASPQLFSNFTVATDNVDLAFDELTSGGVLKIGFPTNSFVFGEGYDFTLTLTEATLEVLDVDASNFWTQNNLTREVPL